MKDNKYWFRRWNTSPVTIRPITWQGFLITWGSLILELIFFWWLFNKTGGYRIKFWSLFLIGSVIYIFILTKIIRHKINPQNHPK